jgi:hypothetical protein
MIVTVTRQTHSDDSLSNVQVESTIFKSIYDLVFERTSSTALFQDTFPRLYTRFPCSLRLIFGYSFSTHTMHQHHDCSDTFSKRYHRRFLIPSRTQLITVQLVI